jgi:nucleoside-diphosphate-sugar epimerase
MTRNISVTGATGFIGRHLLESLSRQQSVCVRALAHSTPENRLLRLDNVTWIRGDLGDPVTVGKLCAEGETLIHLAYPADWPAQAHLESTGRLAEMAAEQGIQRVIHCSTAVVVGKAPSQRITETTQVAPGNEYEMTKFRLEAEWLKQAAGKFDLAIARPTAVFGPGSKNLLSLANALTKGNPLVNYMRSSLFGDRRMNLVCVQNVVSALEFLVANEAACAGRAYLITDDDDPLNNFRDVENILRKALGLDDNRPRLLPVPSTALRLLLHCSGRSSTNPQRTYEGSRLREAGWRKVCGIEEGLRAFAAWYIASRGAA